MSYHNNSQIDVSKLTLDDIGCIFDSANGVYIGEYVQQLARHNGMKGRIVNRLNHLFGEYWDSAEQFLNDKLQYTGIYFGSNDNGDWGLWETLNTDEIDRLYDDMNLTEMPIDEVYKLVTDDDSEISHLEPRELIYILELRINNNLNTTENKKYRKLLTELEKEYKQTAHK